MPAPLYWYWATTWCFLTPVSLLVRFSIMWMCTLLNIKSFFYFRALHYRLLCYGSKKQVFMWYFDSEIQYLIPIYLLLNRYILWADNFDYFSLQLHTCVRRKLCFPDQHSNPWLVYNVLFHRPDTHLRRLRAIQRRIRKKQGAGRNLFLEWLLFLMLMCNHKSHQSRWCCLLSLSLVQFNDGAEVNSVCENIT